ncbi:MAG: hypothetical protein A3K18_32755 [Lentisphaerae bacterium RIFOXYA12_64_32]|nr:MAG: hypothetical protein A3K18_32755 [Lentisphaerae bacterium RIFOXYA12_64_32]
MERGGKSATGGATPLWLRCIARTTYSSQSGVAVPPDGLDSAAALHMPLSMAAIRRDPDAFAKCDGHAAPENLSTHILHFRFLIADLPADAHSLSVLPAEKESGRQHRLAVPPVM